MTVKEIQHEYHNKLSNIYSKGEVAAITSIALERIGKYSRMEVLQSLEKQLERNTELKLRSALEKLLQHHPIQYITGEAWFYNLIFEVNSAVLIPRSETEELVLEAINFIKSDKCKSVLDIGTGSGCIPISIKKNVTEVSVTSLDISKDALDLAKKNADTNEVEINFLKIDFLDESEFQSLSVYDVIISNPPYIPEDEINVMGKNVTLHEPHLALFVPQHDPYIFYKKISLFAEKHLAKYGKIFLEVHEDYAKQTAEIFDCKKYDVLIKKDMQGKDRMLIISRCR